MAPKIDFFVLNELFLNLGGIASASELQGMLCGRLCGARELSKAEWLKHARDFMDIAHVGLNDEQSDLITRLYHESRHQLEDDNFAFLPLLPDDESSIRRRTEELGLWCQGFLHGLGASGLSGEAQLQAETADALRDIAQISQVDLAEDDNLEENEVYWQELVEYVKVAVLTIYQELASKAPPGNSQAVH